MYVSLHYDVLFRSRGYSSVWSKAPSDTISCRVRSVRHRSLRTTTTFTEHEPDESAMVRSIHSVEMVDIYDNDLFFVGIQKVLYLSKCFFRRLKVKGNRNDRAFILCFSGKTMILALCLSFFCRCRCRCR